MRTAIILIAIAAGLAATAAHADCLLTDNRGPNHDGAEFCIKSDKGMSQAQIDAWYLEEAKKNIAKREANRLFNVTSEQYSRGLQLMKAKGLFDSYSHSCESQSDGTGYRCEDHVDRIAVVYYADNETTRINSITVGAAPENTDRAAVIAAGIALSLNTKFVSLPTASPIVATMLLTLQSEIQRNMDRIFISGGSDVSMTNDAMFVYFLNTKKDMSIVHVTRRAPL